jgi:hypothetical protein
MGEVQRARVPVPARIEKRAEPAAQTATAEAAEEANSTARALMSQAQPARQDPWLAPLAGLVLAFSVISFILQLLIAFG